MPTLVRPRTASLVLRLAADGSPGDSDLTLATRDGEVVWRGQVGLDAWRAGLRLRGRCQSTWEDALWLMTRTLLETELGSHGLARDGSPDLEIDVRPGDDGVRVATGCRVIPMARYPLLQDTVLHGADPLAAVPPAAVAALGSRAG